MYTSNQKVPSTQETYITVLPPYRPKENNISFLKMNPCNQHLRLRKAIEDKATELQREKEMLKKMEGVGNDFRTGINFLCNALPGYCHSNDLEPPEISMNNKECIDTFLRVISTNKKVTEEIPHLNKVLKKLLKANGKKWKKSWSKLDTDTKCGIAATCTSKDNQEAWRNLQITFDGKFNELQRKVSGLQYDFFRCIAALQVEGEGTAQLLQVKKMTAKKLLQVRKNKDEKHDIAIDCDEQAKPTSDDNTKSPQNRNANCDRKKSGKGKKKGVAQHSPKSVMEISTFAYLPSGHNCISPNDTVTSPPVIERKDKGGGASFSVPSKPIPVSSQREIISLSGKRKKMSLPMHRGSELDKIPNTHKRKDRCNFPSELSCPVEKKRRVARDMSFADLIAHDYSAQLERSLVKLQNGGNEGPHAKTGRGQILNKIESAKGLWSIEAIGSSNQQGIQHENDLVRNMISSVETGLIEIR